MDLICNNCSQPNPPNARACSHCSSVFPVLAAETLLAAVVESPASAAVSSGTLVDTGGTGTMIDPGPPPNATSEPSPSQGAAQRARTDSGALQPGARLGSRYEIVKLLGKGGMGAVYLARDLDLGRDVAMKLIAPHLANEGAVLERFKREIQLSSIVTHQNVLRIFDLGESDGLKFLTMQFIEGETLADLLARERPLPLDRMLTLFRQICDGLAAAHEKGVLHRDLKPQNVMLDAAGHVYLMDFGLATSRTMTAMTQAGAVMGTPQYMSPEQVKGTATDARSDIFSLGVMLYEMLSGELPFTGDSLFEIMVKRTLGPPRPVGELNPSIPSYLQQMVDRCLAIDPVLRYHSMAELLFDLDAGTVKAPIKKRRGPSTRTLVAGAALVAALLAGGIATKVGSKLAGKATGPPKTVMLLVGDVDNRTGEAIFNGTFEPALVTQLEGASFISSYARGSALKVADQLKLEGTGLGEKRARLVAQREGIAVVTTGFIEKEGAGYRLGVRAVDAFTGQRLMEEAVEVKDKEKALGAVAGLSARLRNTLGDATPVGVQVKEAETYSAASLEAAHEYALGAALTSAGKTEDAKARYLEALKLDPNMSRALAQLGAMEAALGHRADAEQHLKEAIARIARMSERERYRTQGLYYLITRDADGAIEAYSALVKQFPADNVALANLGMAYAMKHDFKSSLEVLRKSIAIYPNNVLTRNNVGLAALFVGDLEGSIKEQEKVIETSASFVNGYVGLAMAQIVAGQHDAALATWNKLQQLGGDKESVAVQGLADLAMHDGRFADARKLLEAAIKADLGRKDGETASRKLAMLAELLLALDHPKPAIAAAERAMKLSQDEMVMFTAGQVYAQTGNGSRARDIANALDSRVAADARMYAELVRGEVELKKGNFGEAVARFRAAVQRLDSWVARSALGRAHLDAGNFPSALDELERCEKRRGEAADAFQETLPTYHLYPPMKYALARAYEGVKSPAAVDAYKAFLAARTSDDDVLVLDARERLERLQRAASIVAK